MNVKLIFKKLFQNLRTEKKETALSLAVLAVAFLSVTAVATILTNLSRVLSGAHENFQLTVYLKDGAEKQKRDALVSAMETYPEVALVRYVSKKSFKKALLADRESGHGALATLDENVFPDTLRVSLAPELVEHSSAAPIVGKLEKVDIVEEVGYHENWMKKLSGFLAFVWAGFLVFGILILLSSLLVMSNVVQLSFSKRSKAIRVMRMCGATPSFIEAPVLLEGFLIGLVSILLSLAATRAAIFMFEKQIAGCLQGFAVPNIHFIPVPAAVALAAVCALTGMSGAYLASRKVLGV